MNGITHKQAQKYMRLGLDGLLTDDQRRDLETHLSECEACRLDAEALSRLTSRLQSGFRSRWDAQDGPSKHVMATVHSQTRRIIMSNRISLGIKALGGIAAVLVIGFTINLVVSQMRDHAVAPNETIVPDNNMPVTIQPEDRLLAFTKGVDGNFEIFTVRADGTELTNLTNDPARDYNPYWSPDGKRIAFNSNRDVNTHNTQVYVMDADGSNVTPLTGGSLSHMLEDFDDGRYDGLGFSPWSPDGSKILFIEKNFSSGAQTLRMLDLATGEQTQLADISPVHAPSWAPDGEHIAFMAIKDSQSEISHIYVVDPDGNNLVDVTGSLKETKFTGFYYDWLNDGKTLSFVAVDTAVQVSIAYEADLHGVLTERARGSLPDGLVLHWRNGITMMGTVSSMSMIWQQPDGTRSELKICLGEQGSRLNFRESNQGNWITGGFCPTNEWMFHWANPDGTTIQKILSVSIPSSEDTRFAYLAWSPDDRFAAFYITTGDNTDMYIVDITRTLGDPTIPPQKIDAGGIFEIKGLPVDSPSWQPVP